MKDSTIKFIGKLTKSDEKNLCQKALKVMEEAGELAKVVLPYENAYATTHRFGTREQILEEVADLYLTSISIAFDLGFTYDEVEEMIERKTIKWAELQQRHEIAKFPVPYEIHISVKNANQEEFRQVCRALDVKPIVLALQVGKKELDDVMTSSKHYGNNQSAYEEMKRISNGLRRSGFQVVREKIETVPWHPGAPSDKHAEPIMPQDCYFETHLGVFIKDDGDDKTIRSLADKFGAHLSKNIFKVVPGGYTQMITYRSYEGTYEQFQTHSKELRDAIRAEGFEIDNVVTEFSIYDTKVTHDIEWIGK